MAGGETNPTSKAKRAAKHAEVRVSVPASLFSEASARRIVDDWLVPVLVEVFLRSRKTSPKSDEGEA